LARLGLHAGGLRLILGVILRPDGPKSGWTDERSAVLYTLAIVLIVLWLLGFVSSYTMGGFIHVLLVIAVIMILVRLITGRKVV